VGGDNCLRELAGTAATTFMPLQPLLLVLVLVLVPHTSKW
jgi:hypothetical protein